MKPTTMPKFRQREEYKRIPIDLIDDPEYPIRGDLSPESVEDLIQSIRKVGIIEPLVVNKKGDRFEVIAGHRRLVAAQVLNFPYVPCVIREIVGQEVDLLKIHENLARAQIDPIDLAKYLQHLKKQYNLSNAKLGELINRSDDYVGIYLQILTYPPDLMEALTTGLINISVARELIKISDPTARSNYLNYAIKGGITPTIAHQWALDWKVNHTETPPPQPEGQEAEPTPPSQTTFTKCGICNEDVEQLKAQVIYVHPDCYAKVRG